MSLHLLRGFVQWYDRSARGKRVPIKTIEGAEKWVEWIAEQGYDQFYTSTSRRPKRIDELRGGSVFFVGGPKRIWTLFRMPIIDIYEGDGGMFDIAMRPELIRVEQKAVGQVRGWRYLEGDAVPPDVGGVDNLARAEQIAELEKLGL